MFFGPSFTVEVNGKPTLICLVHGRRNIFKFDQVKRQSPPTVRHGLCRVEISTDIQIHPHGILRFFKMNFCDFLDDNKVAVGQSCWVLFSPHDILLVDRFTKLLPFVNPQQLIGDGINFLIVFWLIVHRIEGLHFGLGGHVRRVIILRWVVQEYGAYEPVVHFFGFSSMLYYI